MNDRPQRKPWQKPLLQVLARTRPDEAVLVNCKDGVGFVSGEDYWLWGSCYKYIAACDQGVCSAIVSS